MHISTLPIIATLIVFTSAADPKIPCTRTLDDWGSTFSYIIHGWGNGDLPDLCQRLRTTVNEKLSCATYRSDSCYTDGKYIEWRFDVAVTCHSGVSIESFYLADVWRLMWEQHVNDAWWVTTGNDYGYISC